MTLTPYEGLSAIYDARWERLSLAYLPFLSVVLRQASPAPRNVLDLACGTGTLAAALAADGTCVTGLDMCPQMLNVARRKCEGLPNVAIKQGDFRCFELNDAFDLVLCCFDSLNYVNQPGELNDVFRCVRAHLTPAGFFIFDVVNEKHFRRVAGSDERHTVAGLDYREANLYDPQARVQEITIVLPWGVEKHYRVPLEHDDVLAAAKINNLCVTEVYGSLGMAVADAASERLFFVVRCS